jgi:hypothetical protein
VENFRSEQTAVNNAQMTNVEPEQLDSVIREGSVYIISKVPANSKIGIVNVSSSSADLSHYVIDSVIMHLVNTDNYTVVERSQLDTVQREQRYQLSGEVSDDTAVSVGRQLGTQIIVTGAITPLGNNYSLRLKITDVQTAQIIGTRMYTIQPDDVLLSLLNTPDNVTAESPKNETPAENNTKQTTVIQGDVNITNNNTTTIQGDVYVNMPQGLGW